MRKIKYKHKFIFETPCPYRYNGIYVGDVNCINCKAFNALDFKSKIVLCQGDEIFENNKAYKMLLCEKKSNYRTCGNIINGSSNKELMAIKTRVNQIEHMRKKLS